MSALLVRLTLISGDPVVLHPDHIVGAYPMPVTEGRPLSEKAKTIVVTVGVGEGCNGEFWCTETFDEVLEAWGAAAARQRGAA